MATLNGSGSNSLTFAEPGSGVRARSGSGSNSVTFAESGSEIRARSGSASNSFAMSESISPLDFEHEFETPVVFGVALSPLDFEHEFASSITFANAAWHHFKDFEAATGITFTQAATLTMDLHIAVAHHIAFLVNKGEMPIDAAASNSFTFAHAAWQAKHGASSVVFSQLAAAVICHAGYGDVVFSQAAAINRDAGRAATTPVVFAQAVLAWIESVGDCAYAPVRDVASGMPATVVPSHRSTITLTCGVAACELRSPAPGDSLTLDTHRLTRDGLTGEIKVHKFTPTTTKLEYKCLACPADAALYETFVTSTLGKEMTLLDYDNLAWTGILFPGETRHGSDDDEISFTFIGVPL